MYIYYPGINNEINSALIGGKAVNLAKMHKAGINIPEWFVITTDAFKHTVDTEYNKPEQMPYIIENAEIPDNIKMEILSTIENLGLKDKFLAVRSSSIGEDSSNHSFAGQLDSFLYVDNEDLFVKIKAVWKSVFSQRALFYRQNNSISPDSYRVAVIVQEMINSDVSGVAFSIDPISGDRETITISSVYGLGEGLVSGLLNADNFKIKNNKIHADIAIKLQYACFDSENRRGTKINDLPVNKRDVSCLDNNQIHNIAREITRISSYLGEPQDIEWVISNEKLYILQSRPVTTINNIPDKTGIKIIWDNSNIIESYSGVTTPLTFSFIQSVYSEVYKQFSRIMGVEDELIELNNSIFQMIGLIKGRVYYNLLNWYRILSLLPGYAINAEFMEQMMGVKTKLDIPPDVIQSSKNKYLRAIHMVYKLTINLISLTNEIKKFYRLLNNTLSSYENTDFSYKKPDELIYCYYNLERKLLKNWHAPLINDFYAMVFYGILKNLIYKWKIDDEGNLQNHLLTGDGDIISSEPILRIRKLANQVFQNEKLKEYFLNNDEETILNAIHSFKIHAEFKDYLIKFGNRCVGELKLETITYKENPCMLIKLIKSYAAQGYVDLEIDNLKVKQIRIEAETKVHNYLRFKPFKRILFHYVLKQTRSRIRNRENLRFERTRLFAVIREIFLAIGKQFYSEGVINNSRDIFYLTKEEIFDYIRGTASTINLKALIKLRKVEFQSYQNETPADRFETNGIVYQSPSFNDNYRPDTGSEGSLSGIGCCPGIVRAKVKIIKNPAEAMELEGCIMVAEKTDPGWVPLFPICKGILVERGSMLSHSAIVAREMGIPAIVGVNNLLVELIDGEIVEMDGAKGTIKIFRGDNG